MYLRFCAVIHRVTGRPSLRLSGMFFCCTCNGLSPVTTLMCASLIDSFSISDGLAISFSRYVSDVSISRGLLSCTPPGSMSFAQWRMTSAYHVHFARVGTPLSRCYFLLAAPMIYLKSSSYNLSQFFHSPLIQGPDINMILKSTNSQSLLMK